MKYHLYDGREVTGKELLALIAKGRTPLKANKTNWIIDDGWLDSSDSRRELWDFYKFLVSHLGKAHSFTVVEVEWAYNLAEGLASDCPSYFQHICFVKNKQSSRFRVDGGKIWLLTIKE